MQHADVVALMYSAAAGVLAPLVACVCSDHEANCYGHAIWCIGHIAAEVPAFHQEIMNTGETVMQHRSTTGCMVNWLFGSVCCCSNSKPTYC